MNLVLRTKGKINKEMCIQVIQIIGYFLIKVWSQITLNFSSISKVIKMGRVIRKF
jgi:hypothetical protein